MHQVRSYSSPLWKNRAAKLTVLFALVFGLDVNGDDIEIDIEIDNIRERLNERFTSRIEEATQLKARSKIRLSLEDEINESVTRAISNQVISNTLSQLPRLDNTPTEFKTSHENRRILETVDLKNTSNNIGALINTQLDRTKNQVDLMLEIVEDKSGNTALANEWLIMTDDVNLGRLIKEGYLVKNIEKLTGLGYVLGTVQAPVSFNPESITSVQIINDPTVTVDLNHVYFPQHPKENSSSHGAATTNQQRTSSDNRGKKWPKIGMIDSSIDTTHEVFSASHITEKSFTPKERLTTAQHGTAIASILVGESGQFHGLSPGSELYNGVVFATDELGREFSTTAALIRAINWLATNDVKLINMSLAGPDNAILRKAIHSACSRGIIIVSAAGNSGPTAKPLYPAAYGCTIAVTAVDNNGKNFHRANRGDHIDYALYGVDVLHAASGNSFDKSSGTSFAAAHLTGLIAANLPQNNLSVEEVKARLKLMATDIGRIGKDPVYGDGFIRPIATSRISN